MSPLSLPDTSPLWGGRQICLANFRVGGWLTHLPTPTPNPPHKGEGASSEQSNG
jgi:hypothetical protein